MDLSYKPSECFSFNGLAHSHQVSGLRYAAATIYVASSTVSFSIAIGYQHWAYFLVSQYRNRLSVFGLHRKMADLIANNSSLILSQTGCHSLDHNFAMQGLGSVLLHTPLQAFDFGQHIFGPGFHFKIGQFTILIVVNTQFVLNSIEHL